MFRDECELSVQAGRGGDGLCSFRREKYVPKGGPDGGDGGNGGDVILRASDRVHSLLSVGRKPNYRAQSGRPGGPRKRSGANGESLEIEVPIGTLIYDRERGHLLRDLCEPGMSFVVAAGGRGGRGNANFATPVRQAPKRADPGKNGESRALRLELKLFAEVGLIGLPNAGKSTLLSATSRATPKVADYPFTTLHPQVGICALGDLETLVMADLPGLIQGASAGAGLGHRFLRHVERCRVLLHLLDCSDEADTPPGEALEVLERELSAYSPELFGRPRILVATKVEDEGAEQRAAALEKELGRPLWRISSILRLGLEELLGEAYRHVHAG